MRMSQVLRVTAAVALFQYAAHAFLFLTAKPQRTEEVTGYGIMVIASGMVEVLLLWAAASLAKRDPEAARPFVWILVVANAAHAAIALRFFFPLPAILDAVVIAGLLASQLVGQSAPSVSSAGT